VRVRNGALGPSTVMTMRKPDLGNAVTQSVRSDNRRAVFFRPVLHSSTLAVASGPRAPTGWFPWPQFRMFDETRQIGFVYIFTQVTWRLRESRNSDRDASGTVIPCCRDGRFLQPTTASAKAEAGELGCDGSGRHRLDQVFVNPSGWCRPRRPLLIDVVSVPSGRSRDRRTASFVIRPARP